MSIELELKRSKKSLEDLSDLDNITLLEGEPFLVLLDKDDTNSDSNKHALLFTGDGYSKISTMYTAGKFTYISKYISEDMLENNSVTNNALADDAIDTRNIIDGKVTKEKLDPNIKWDMGNLNLLNIPYEALSDDSLINLNKLYNVDCNTESNIELKTVNIEGIPVIREDEEDPNSDIDKSAYVGLTLIVRFKYSNNTVGHPTMRVYSVKDGNRVFLFNSPLYIGSMMIGDEDISYSKTFYWKDDDSLIFTWTKMPLDENHLTDWYAWQMAGTSASRVLASWCSENNTTLINGAMIATGSIAADKIAAGSITADQIAVGTIPASALQDSLSTALNNLQVIEKQSTSARQIVAVCDTPAGQNPKQVFLEGQDALTVSIKDNMPIPGTTLIVKFKYPNLLGTVGSTTTSLKLMLDSIPFPDGVGKGYSIVTYNKNESVDVKEDFLLNWTGCYNEDPLKDTSGNNIRTLIFNGSEWEVQPTNGDLLRAANWCLEHNQSYIHGGSIVTGRIYADQINAGSLNVGNINLFAADQSGQTVAVLERYYGEADGVSTYGMMMAGSDKDHFYIVTTNRGCRMQGGNGGRVYSYGGVTTDENGNTKDSTDGYSGIDHNRSIQIGHHSDDSVTNSIYVHAKTLFLDCNAIKIKTNDVSNYDNSTLYGLTNNGQTIVRPLTVRNRTDVTALSQIYVVTNNSV